MINWIGRIIGWICEGFAVRTEASFCRITDCIIITHDIRCATARSIVCDFLGSTAFVCFSRASYISCIGWAEIRCATIILCSHTVVGLLTEIRVICWAEPLTFCIGGTLTTVGAMSVELIGMPCKDGIISTINTIAWWSKTETLDGDTTVNRICRSTESENRSDSTINGSEKSERVHRTTRVDRSSRGWSCRTRSTSDRNRWSSSVSSSSIGDLCKSSCHIRFSYCGLWSDFIAIITAILATLGKSQLGTPRRIGDESRLIITNELES